MRLSILCIGFKDVPYQFGLRLSRDIVLTHRRDLLLTVALLPLLPRHLLIETKMRLRLLFQPIRVTLLRLQRSTTWTVMRLSLGGVVATTSTE